MCADVTSKTAAPGVGYIRILEFTPQAASNLKSAIDRLARTGATKYIIALRGTARGDLDEGVAAARLFVKTGTVAIKQTKNDQREVVTAQPTDGSVTAPVVLLTTAG